MRDPRMRFVRFVSAGVIVAANTWLLGCSEGHPMGVGGGGGSEATGSVSSSSGSSSGFTTGSGSSSGSFPPVFKVTGIVTDGQKPVPESKIMQGGGEPAFETGLDGTFTIEMTTALPGIPTLVAAKVGFRSGAVEFVEAPTEPVEIVLHEVVPPDNATTYAYGAPGVGDAQVDNSTAYCGHCHTTLVAQFQTSAHAKATRDVLVQDLYAGTAQANAQTCVAAGGSFRDGLVPGTTNVAPRCYLGGGVLPDLNGCGGPNALSCDDPSLNSADKPSQFGHCADCHAAGLPGPTGGRNLLEATGLAYENGNHCDVCHKVRDVDLSKPAGVAGRLMIQRPHETVTGEPGSKLRQVMFGPLMDVPNEFMGGSYQPKFSQAVFCAGCHEQQQEALIPGTSLNPARFPNGLPTHSTYSEWSESGWAAAGAQCQHCHMPPNQGLVNTVDTTMPDKASITYGFPRPPEEIRAHTFRGPLSKPSRLLDIAVEMWLDTKIINGDLAVQVKLVNQGAGHALPTGEPMRSLLLVVQANACGQRLSPKDGLTIDDVGGALAQGLVGQGISVLGKTWSWNAAVSLAKPGQVLRVLRDTGQWVDYPGIGFFANPALGPADKGIPLRLPVGEAKIESITNGEILVDREIPVLPGDTVWLGHDLPNDFVDGASTLALAGVAGQSFARVLVDSAGERLVPHYKAVDIVSDNRLPPLDPITTNHLFALPPGCSSSSVKATALYRPVPLHFGLLRGWNTLDWVAAVRNETILVP